MKTVRSSAISHLISRKKNNKNPSASISAIYTGINDLLKVYEPFLDARVNTATHYELWTKHTFRTTSFHPTSKKGLMFVACSIFDRHVSLYFYPFSYERKLAENMTDNLKKQLKFKTCFHFTELTKETIQDLKILLKAGWDFYESNHWVSTN
jgi:hypothetical protein